MAPRAQRHRRGRHRPRARAQPQTCSPLHIPRAHRRPPPRALPFASLRRAAPRARTAARTDRK
eukprot:3931839-Rhodomonas_salina.1